MFKKNPKPKQKEIKPTFNNTIIPEKLLYLIDSTYKLPDTNNYEEYYFSGYQEETNQLPYFCEGYYNDDSIKDYALLFIKNNSEQVVYSFHSESDSIVPYLISNRVLRKIKDNKKRNIIDLIIQTETERKLEAIDTIYNIKFDAIMIGDMYNSRSSIYVWNSKNNEYENLLFD